MFKEYTQLHTKVSQMPRSPFKRESPCKGHKVGGQEKKTTITTKPAQTQWFFCHPDFCPQRYHKMQFNGLTCISTCSIHKETSLQSTPRRYHLKNPFILKFFPEVAEGRISYTLHKEGRVHLFFLSLRLISTVELLEPGLFPALLLQGNYSWQGPSTALVRRRKTKQTQKETQSRNTSGLCRVAESSGDRREMTNAAWCQASEACKSYCYYY